MVDMSDLLKIVDFITVSNFVLDKKYYKFKSVCPYC